MFKRIATLAGIVTAGAALSLATVGSAGAATPAAASTAAHGSHARTGAVYIDNTAIVVNQSNQPLTATSMSTDLANNVASWSGFGPFVGQVIQPGGEIQVDWLDYCPGS